jgi:hypothetical protein
MTIIIKLICIIYIQNSMKLLNDNYNKINMYNLYSNSIELLNDNHNKINMYNLYSKFNETIKWQL